MDKYSEKEVKFRADTVDVSDFDDYVKYLIKSGYKQTLKKKAHGIDTFYDLNGKTLRLRQEHEGSERVEITYKARKRKGSLTDRVEVNVDVKTDQGDNVIALFEHLGAVELFTIWKDSHIYVLKGFEHTVCIAMYDVTPWDSAISDYKVDEFGSLEKDRYLEIEIEAHSPCTDKIGLEELHTLSKSAQSYLDLKKPINKSLFEIYLESERL